MNIIKDENSKKISIIDDSGSVNLELYFIPSFFVFVFHTKKPIIVKSENDEIFYHNLTWLMENHYEFSHKYSNKYKNELIWFSEHCFNIEDEEQCEMTSRLIIKKINQEFHIFCSNPFYEKNNINKSIVVSLSPCGNGFYSKNNKTGLSLQDDVITVFYNTLYEKKINNKQPIKKIKMK